MATVSDILTLKAAIEFTRQAIGEARARGLPITSGSVDHLCFRVETMADYHEACSLLASESIPGLEAELLTESIVNGRPISAFKFRCPLKVDDQNIPLIEIPAPKPGKFYKTGFEHIEVVIGMSFSELKKLCPTTTLEGDANTGHELVFHGATTTVKFHQKSLEDTIQLELGNA